MIKITDKAYAIVPARSGSKGVPQKNIIPLAGYPLLAYSILAAKNCPGIDRVIVSTDDEEIAKLSRQYGAETPFLRPKELAQDNSTDREFLDHAMDWFEANDKSIPEYWVHLRPTTPLRDPKHIEEALKVIRSQSDATSLRSGHEAAESPFKWFVKNEEGLFQGILPADPRPEYYNLPRQHFPKVYIPDGYVDIVRSSHLLAHDSIHGNKMIGYTSPFCYEVDTVQDLEQLEFYVQKHSHPLLKLLEPYGP